jgi:hypothetical protein
MNAKFLIRVGTGAEYQLRYGRNGFAVFRKTLGRVVSYIIAKELKSGISDSAPIPSSPLREYGTQDEAVAALDKWANAPKDVALLRPRPSPTAYSRRNSNRPRNRKWFGPGQLDFFNVSSKENRPTHSSSSPTHRETITCSRITSATEVLLRRRRHPTHSTRLTSESTSPS